MGINSALEYFIWVVDNSETGEIRDFGELVQGALIH